MEHKEQDTTELIFTERLANYLEAACQSLEKPFGPPSRLVALLAALSRSFTKGIETLIGTSLYVRKPTVPVYQIPARFHKLIHRLADLGIIQSISFLRPIPGWPRLPNLHLVTQRVSGTGYALDPELAATKALAELIERHALIAPAKTGDFIGGTWEELRERGAVNPLLLAAFSEAQLAQPKYAPHWITPSSPYSWVKARSFFTSTPHLIPAQLVYLDYPLLPAEPHLRQTVGNGVAAGLSQDMAICHAISEAIERDAWLIHWLNQIAPPRVDLSPYKKKSGNRYTPGTRRET